MNTEEALSILKSRDEIEGSQFEILQVVASEVNKDPDSTRSKELVLRALENHEYFSETKSVLHSLVREVGLFPYLDQDALSLKETIAYEYHRPENLKDIVFHQEQLPVYQKILEGKNIVLSAPTSFGKSKIIDVLVADQVFANIVIVVPTLALIDETRRRMTQQFSSIYNIVAHPSQGPSEEKNIFIFTPERIVAYKNQFPKINFFIIDEFYKIGGQSEEDRRMIALNEAFYYLYKKQKAQFYMLGPNIQTVSEGAGKRFNFEFISTDFNTVITETVPVHIRSKQERLPKLVEICKSLTEPTLIYCKSPAQIYEIAEGLLAGRIGDSNNLCGEVADWLGEEFHPDWALPRALRCGIGLHYGPLPRSIAQEMVRLFNDGEINFLVCTSTLIEGVNTKAKNVIIYENKIARQKLDYFTFNNIKGRSGRMFEHFVGRVFCFDDEPQPKLPFVDFPLHSQVDSTPESLLIQLDPEDLNDEAKERVNHRATNSPLPIWLLKESHGIEPESQVAVYNEILEEIDVLHNFLSWTGLPKYKELEKCCELIWKHWILRGKNGVLSYKQLSLKLFRLRNKQPTANRIAEELQGKYAAPTANEAVGRILSFDRNWAGFDFPQLIMALDRIQRFVFKSNNLSPGDYSFFATQVETLFLPEVCIALDEFGVPINLSQKCAFLTQAENLTEALTRLRDCNIDSLELRLYEKTLLRQAREGI